MICQICQLTFTDIEYSFHIQTNFHRLNQQRPPNSQPLSLQSYCENLVQSIQDKPIEQQLLSPYNNQIQHSCIFCAFTSTSMDILNHMHEKHQYQFISLEYLTNPDEFLEFLILNQKIYKICLFCNQSFDSVSSLCRHQKRKSHEKYTLSQTISQFFDFTASWPKELQSEKFAQFQPFQLWDKESIQRFQRNNFIGNNKIRKTFTRFLKNKDKEQYEIQFESLTSLQKLKAVIFISVFIVMIFSGLFFK